MRANLSSDRDNFRLQRLAVILILVILVIGLSIRLLSILRYTSFDFPGYHPDAAIHSFACIETKDALVAKFSSVAGNKGSWYWLGPPVSQARYSLPPLFYYLVLPAAFFGANPIILALPNVLFSWLSILLIMVFIYQLLENTQRNKRIFLSILSGFWYSIFFVDIFFNSYLWNPSMIPFFLLCFLLLYKYQMESKGSFAVQIFYWSLYGIVLAILMSLHSASLFVMPIVFVLSCIVFLVRNLHNPRKWLLPPISVFTALAVLYPYLYSDYSRDWCNTRLIFVKLNRVADEANAITLVKKLTMVAQNYLGLGWQAYFIGLNKWGVIISYVFLPTTIIMGMLRFKGNRILGGSLLLILFVYCLAVSNYTGRQLVHYKYLILLFPLIFTILALAYFDYSRLSSKIISSFLIFGICISALTNIYYNYRHLEIKYGRERLMSSNDMIEVLRSIPEGSTVSPPEYTFLDKKKFHPFKFINRYVTRKEINFVSLEELRPDSYVIVTKREFRFIDENKLGPVFKIVENKSLVPKEWILVWENPSLYVYHVEKR
jgi:hypothetical protein